MKVYNYNIGLLLVRLSLALLLFFISRVFFIIYNVGLFSDLSYYELLVIFVNGLRFDISAICFLNILFVLLHVIPFGKLTQRKGFQLMVKIVFVTINGLLTLFNFSDSIYFHFVQKRSTADIFKFIFVSDDVGTLLPGFIIDYWFVPVIVLILMVITWFIYPSYNPPNSARPTSTTSKIGQLLYKLIIMLIVIGLTVVGARGGLQLKPLGIIDASQNVKAAHMPIVLNSVFTCITTIDRNNLEEKTYMDDSESHVVYPLIHDFRNEGKSFNNKNIVVLLLESFSKEYVGSLNNYRGFTPFLDSLSDHALVFENAFANGLRSIDAIPAIVSGIPTLMDDPFITSIYNTNQTNSLPEMLGRKGYHTSFFHGGTNGTMNFNGYAAYAGFMEYHGRFEYNNDEDYDNHWGIFDEPFLQYFANKLNEIPEPFFAFEFTLSSHYPYHLPVKYNDRFPEGTMKIHRVVRYSDYALMKFFETAQKMPWYNNTLFVIVADHPAQSVIPVASDEIKEKGEELEKELVSYYKNTSGRYAIPLMLFNPGDTSFIGINSGTVQQTDLMPTILDYLNYDEPFLSFGSSMLRDDNEPVAVQFVNGLYQITSGKYSLLFDGTRSISLYDNSIDPEHKNNLVKNEKEVVAKLEIRLKAIVQQYLTRMVNNDMVVRK